MQWDLKLINNLFIVIVTETVITLDIWTGIAIQFDRPASISLVVDNYTSVLKQERMSCSY